MEKTQQPMAASRPLISGFPSASLPGEYFMRLMVNH